LNRAFRLYMGEKPINATINSIYWLCMAPSACFGITLPSSGSVPSVVSRDVVRPHSILSTAPQLSISQKALGTLPEDCNVMPKHVGATIHN
jgi:hypothetical protein